MPRLSVICVYDDKAILEARLLRSLRGQIAEYELVLVDNVEHQFHSASAALNSGASKAVGDYLLFTHQDVSLETNSALEQLLETAETLPRMGVAGVAGAAVTAELGEVMSNMTHGNPPQKVGRITPSVPVLALTVDECFFAVPRTVFSKFRFDESTCDDWHLYASDYCLTAQGQGYLTYVLPLRVHHQSGGRRTRAYYKTLGKLLDKHRPRNTTIHTTTGVWSTRFPPCAQMGVGVAVWSTRKICARIGVANGRVTDALARIGSLFYTPPW